MYWYVHFVRTGMEQKIVQFINKQQGGNIFTPFIPMQEILFKKFGL